MGCHAHYKPLTILRGVVCSKMTSFAHFYKAQESLNSFADGKMSAMFVTVVCSLNWSPFCADPETELPIQPKHIDNRKKKHKSDLRSALHLRRSSLISSFR